MPAAAVVVAFLTGLILVLGAALAQGGLALFTDLASVPDNNFSTAASFDCTAGNTGFLNPTAEAFDTGGDDNGFELNPTNAFADGGTDPNYKAENINGNGDRHRFYNYVFSIPAGCKIRGIEVRLDWWLDATQANNSMSVELSWDGGTSWTAAKTDTQETTTEHSATLGSSTDRWGRTWAISDFTDANFRVRVTSSGGNVRDFFLDWVPVNVRYVEAQDASLVSVADSHGQEDLATTNFGTATLMDAQSYAAQQNSSFTSVADSYGQEDLATTNFGSATSMDVQSFSPQQNSSFTSVADTYVQEDLGDSNFGTATLMDVQSYNPGTAQNRRSFAQFDVSSIPAGSTIVGADLTICWAAVPSVTTYDVHRVTASWGETAVTWNTQPTVAAAATDSKNTPGNPGCKVFSVDGDVQAWVDGTANNGWRISDSAEGSATQRLSQLRTRENGVTAERPTLDVTYTLASGENRRSFVQFDVSSIPAGSTVNSATVTLCATAVPSVTRTYELRTATASWVESAITWNDQPAVDAITDTATTPATPGCMSWTVTADVQAWVDGTANNGWRISDSVENSVTQYLTQFRTSEDSAVPAEQPKLDVTYTPPTGHNNRRSFVQFDVSSIPGGSPINSATLTLCATAVPSVTRSYELRTATASWVESGITWANQPAVGGITDTATTPATPGCMTWTVTADVQAWVDGTANNGWRINDSTESSVTQYLTQLRTRENGVTAERPTLDVTYLPP